MAAATDVIDTTAVARLRGYLAEAVEGPERGGVAGDLNIAGVTIEVAASRGWGVQFSREMPDGNIVKVNLAPQDANITAASTALASLLAAA